MTCRRAMTILLAVACSGCAGDRLQALSPFGGPGGIIIAPVEIDSSPTRAWVYIDGWYVCNTPLVYGLAYDIDIRYFEVIAEPLPDHPVQLRQTKHIRVPPRPTRLHFFMNNHDNAEDDG